MLLIRINAEPMNVRQYQLKLIFFVSNSFPLVNLEFKSILKLIFFIDDQVSYEKIILPLLIIRDFNIIRFFFLLTNLTI